MQNHFIVVIRNILMHVLYLKKKQFLWTNGNVLKNHINAINIVEKNIEKTNIMDAYLLCQVFHNVHKNRLQVIYTILSLPLKPCGKNYKFT